MGEAMRVIINDGTAEFLDDEKLCGTYHYEDPFKSYFRGLYTPDGHDVVDPPPKDHPHHKGLQFGLCLSDVNFWEEDLANEPKDRQLPIGRQLTDRIDALPITQGIGFTQAIEWRTNSVVSFREIRIVTLAPAPDAYVWTWRSTLIASRNLKILTSVWPGPGYTGVGLRLAKALFQHGHTVPPDIASGAIAQRVCYFGQGVAVTFEQQMSQANVLFLSRYEDQDPAAFAFMSFGPTNARELDLREGEYLEGIYVVTVATQ
jgi:hypothetical protein